MTIFLIFKTRQEILKGETKITNITEKERIIEDNVIHPTSSSTCMFNARNKQLEKQLQAAELQMRQQGDYPLNWQIIQISYFYYS